MPAAPRASRSILVQLFLLLAGLPAGDGAAAEILPGTTALTGDADLSELMAAGVSRFFDRQTEQSTAGRAAYWQPDFSSRGAYAASVCANRERLRRILGVVDTRVPLRELELVATLASPALLAETPAFSVRTVRWPVLPGVHGEGLLLQPKGNVIASVVVLPDADQTPEALAGLGSE